MDSASNLASDWAPYSVAIQLSYITQKLRYRMLEYIHIFGKSFIFLSMTCFLMLAKKQIMPNLLELHRIMLHTI